MYRSSRTTPEPRVELANDALRLDFDPRTSDTMYNYLHMRRPDGRWERAHNFGIDLRARLTTADPEPKNLIGMNLNLHRDGQAMRVTYPRPLIQYRHFDDKVGGPAVARQYPDFSPAELQSLPHADASAEFLYSLDSTRPSFVMSGRVLSGPIVNLTYIISALWTDNHALPTHQYVEDCAEWDLSLPEAASAKELTVQNVAYMLFYRHDGRGLPFALLPLQPVKARFNNYFDNAKCLADFGAASVNQHYVPAAPAVRDTNDAGYIVEPDARGVFPGVRVAFFPDLAWQPHLRAHALRAKLIESIERDYLDAARVWNRVEQHLWRQLSLMGPPRL